MKINSINSAMPLRAQRGVSKVSVHDTQRGMNLKVVSMSEYMASPLSFKGRNKEQAIFYGAEVAPYSKAGGVGVVMKDYGMLLDPKDEVVVSPYYGAQKDENGNVRPLKQGDDYVLKVGKDLLKLDLVAEKNMQWGDKKNNKIMLFSLRDEAEKVHYFVFDETTGEFEKPYQAPKGGAKFAYASGAKAATNAWNGDPYAKNSKAFVELLPELIADKKDFNPATVVCSDSQTAYTHEYIVQKAVANDKDYDEIKTTHVGHNLGPGYCGETSMQNMFVNLGATPEQIKMVEADPIYRQGLLGDNYFKPFVKETLDETGTASATQIALHHASKERANGNGFVKAFSVVAEDYADAIANNPQAAHNIHQTAKKLHQDGVFNGILNPLEDPKIDATRELPNPRYGENCVDTDGKVYPAFEVYPADASYSQMRDIKNANKLKLFERFSAKDVTIITGDGARKANINPEAKGVYDGPIIRQDLMDLIAQGKGDEVPLFVSWGRLDTQKGFDIATDAFEKFAKTPEGKNAVLVVGAGLIKDNPESDRVENKIKSMLADPDLQGRVVHIDGWAPAYALASAADAALFTSRFEPCGLTDIEAMKYYCTPIVTNTQGFKQKNFDPRNSGEVEKATSFKTQHEFDLLKSQVQLIVDAYVNNDANSLAKVKGEFPVFASKDAQGNDVYDDTLFVNFAKGYTEYMEGLKSELLAQYGSEDKFPTGWNDWDELSKDYSFKYSGFARDLKDGILKAETAKAIAAYTETSADTKATMFENLKKLNTGWKGNANLHPSNESSYEMYKKYHMMADYSKPTELDVIGKSSRFIENTIESRQKTDVEERIGSYIIGALSGVAVALATKFKNAGKAQPNQDLLNQIDSLKQQLVDQSDLQSKLSIAENKLSKALQANKRNMIIAIAASAIGGAAVAILGSKYAKKKKAASAPLPKVAATTVSQPIETKKQTVSASSPATTAVPSNGLFSSFSNFA